mmetsp:Transcript_818/g.1561  ORF Transcript_818/g.1561 Transcript_818/m.1561 type:complete len:226 (-) Transcript_818:262-939(-)
MPLHEYVNFEGLRPVAARSKLEHEPTDSVETKVEIVDGEVHEDDSCLLVQEACSLHGIESAFRVQVIGRDHLEVTSWRIGRKLSCPCLPNRICLEREHSQAITVNGSKFFSVNSLQVKSTVANWKCILKLRRNPTAIVGLDAHLPHPGNAVEVVGPLNVQHLSNLSSGIGVFLHIFPIDAGHEGLVAVLPKAFDGVHVVEWHCRLRVETLSNVSLEGALGVPRFA